MLRGEPILLSPTPNYITPVEGDVAGSWRWKAAPVVVESGSAALSVICDRTVKSSGVLLDGARCKDMDEAIAAYDEFLDGLPGMGWFVVDVPPDDE